MTEFSEGIKGYISGGMDKRSGDGVGGYAVGEWQRVEQSMVVARQGDQTTSVGVGIW